jgi:hypothetical protein
MTPRTPLRAALVAAVVVGLAGCGGGVVDSVPAAVSAPSGAPSAAPSPGAPSPGAPSPGAPSPGGPASGTSSASGVTIADGVVSFPAELGVPDLTLPEGAGAYDTTFNATIGVTVTEADPVALAESVSAQLTAAGYTVVPIQDGTAQATKEGAADVLVSGGPGTISDISVSPLR